MHDGPRRKSLRLGPELYRDEGRAVFVTVSTSPRRPVFASDDFDAACVEVLEGTVGRWKSLCCRSWWRRGHRGSFWQRSFVDRFLRSERDVQAAVWYTLANPVRAGLVDAWDEYPLSGVSWRRGERA